MEGTNEIHMNAATMREAVQLWCNKHFVAPPTVKDVREHKGDAQVQTFIIKVDSDCDKPGPEEAAE